MVAKHTGRFEVDVAADGDLEDVAFGFPLCYRLRQSDNRSGKMEEEFIFTKIPPGKDAVAKGTFAHVNCAVTCRAPDQWNRPKRTSAATAQPTSATPKMTASLVMTTTFFTEKTLLPYFATTRKSSK